MLLAVDIAVKAPAHDSGPVDAFHQMRYASGAENVPAGRSKGSPPLSPLRPSRQLGVRDRNVGAWVREGRARCVCGLVGLEH